MPEFGDVKAGDKFVAVHTSGARFEAVAKYVGQTVEGLDTNAGVSIDPYKGWTIESITQAAPPEVFGTVIRNVTTSDGEAYDLAVHDGDNHVPWLAFADKGYTTSYDTEEITSWEGA